MEIKAFKEAISSCGERWCSRLELPLEAELLIPDYQPPVFKIVKTIVHPVVLQKHTAEKKLALEGYLRCSIFYQSEDGCRLCQIEQKIPFSKTMELPDGVFRDELIETCGEVEYMNCRATHSRRLELRGSYGLQLSSAPQVEKSVITQITEKELEQKSGSVSGLGLLPCTDRVITSQEEIEAGQLPGEVLYISGSGQVDEIQKLEEKAVIKGKLNGIIWYSLPEERSMRSKAVSLPFRQVADIPKLGEQSLCQAEVEPIGWTLEGREDGSAELTVTSMLHFKAWQTQTEAVVEDAFSVSCQTEAQYSNLCLEQLSCTLAERLPCTVSIPAEEGSEPLLRLVQAEKPILRDGMLAGKGVLYLFLRNSTGEMECREQAFEYCWGHDLPEKGDLFASLEPGEITLRRNGAQLLAEFDLTLQGVLLESRPVSVLQSLTLGQPLEEAEDAPALHIYYARPGQSVFGIAKALCASPKTMMACNGLTQDILEQPQHLLVPRAD